MKEKASQAVKCYYPFGEILKPVVQQDRTKKKVFVLGVYASAVHARWIKGNETICQALAVASEPCIFWDGNEDEAARIINKILIPKELGCLVPAASHLNGPSGRILDEHILKPLGYTRNETWLCDLFPKTMLNPSQVKVLENKYEPLIGQYGLNPVTIPHRKNKFCDQNRCEEILEELEESQAELIILLGDIPIKQFLKNVANVEYSTLQEYVNIPKYGYGNCSEIVVNNRTIKVLPLAHPRQIGALGAYSKKWQQIHLEWEKKVKLCNTVKY